MGTSRTFSKYFTLWISLLSGLSLLISCFPESKQIDTKVEYFISGEFDNRFFYLNDLNNSFGSYIPDQDMIVLNAGDNNIELIIQIYNFNINSQNLPLTLPGDSSQLSYCVLKLTPGPDTPGIGGRIWSGSTRNPDELSIIIENFNSRLDFAGSFEGVIKDFEGNEIRVDKGEFSLILKEILL